LHYFDGNQLNKEDTMKRSTERILTTHVGSLARPDSLVPLLRQREEGQPYDRNDLARLVREAVADVVRQQIEAGIDIVNDGEQGKASFFGYVVERFSGFERKPFAPGEVRPRALGREYVAFPDYYAWSERIAEPFGGRSGSRGHGVDTCTGPVSYRGHAAVQADIDNLKAATKGRTYEDVFVPAIASPTSRLPLPTHTTVPTRNTSRPSPMRCAKSIKPLSMPDLSYRSMIRAWSPII
jgi:5-methyltetrahydropteroyltriglutamate--homocysteine methyltransferase